MIIRPYDMLISTFQKHRLGNDGKDSRFVYKSPKRAGITRRREACPYVGDCDETPNVVSAQTVHMSQNFRVRGTTRRRVVALFFLMTQG